MNFKIDTGADTSVISEKNFSLMEKARRFHSQHNEKEETVQVQVACDKRGWQSPSREKCRGGDGPS